MTTERKVIDQMAEALGARPTKVIELYQSWSDAISTWPPSIQLQASQLVGIAYRLESDYPAAINAFKNALMFADLLEDTVKVSSILRDQAMVYLKMAELEPGSKDVENYFDSAYRRVCVFLKMKEQTTSTMQPKASLLDIIYRWETRRVLVVNFRRVTSISKSRTTKTISLTI